MQQKINCMHVCAYMHGFSPCMLVFARKSKLLIVRGDEWNSSPPSVERCSKLRSIPDPGNWRWRWFFFLPGGNISVCHSSFLPFSPPHFTSQSNIHFCFKSNTFSVIPLLYFDSVMLSEYALQSNTWMMCVYVCVGKDWKCVCVCMLSPPRLPWGITVQSVSCAW